MVKSGYFRTNKQTKHARLSFFPARYVIAIVLILRNTHGDSLSRLWWKVFIIKVQDELLWFEPKVLVEKHGSVGGYYVECDIFAHTSSGSSDRA